MVHHLLNTSCIFLFLETLTRVFWQHGGGKNYSSFSVCVCVAFEFYIMETVFAELSMFYSSRNYKFFVWEKKEIVDLQTLAVKQIYNNCWQNCSSNV